MFTADNPNRYVCQCCGQDAFQTGRLERRKEWGGGQSWRCDRHLDRNPCAIEGCARTTAAKGQFADDSWMCGTHWRMFVPPGSRARRQYHRYFRRAKRFGWGDGLNDRFWRFWKGIVADARRKSQGDVDMTEINRMFGWSD